MAHHAVTEAVHVRATVVLVPEQNLGQVHGHGLQHTTHWTLKLVCKCTDPTTTYITEARTDKKNMLAIDDAIKITGIILR